MRAVRIELAGRERYLCFTVEAMFRIEEEFGGTRNLIEVIADNSREGLSALCAAAAILAEQGELARRQMGYESEPMMDAAAVSASIIHPADLARLRVAVTNAITLGYGREVEPENDEVDLGLAELDEQKKQSRPGPLHPHRRTVRSHPAGDDALRAGRGGGPAGALAPGQPAKTKAGG